MNHMHDTDPRVTPRLQRPATGLTQRRTHTRQQWLHCPAERSQSALHRQPSCGMWAGVWIDGDLPAKRICCVPMSLLL